jgi:hypothetical protein
MNISEIIQGAQGGQGIDNLASQFGLTSEQTQAAIQAILPGLSKGLRGAAQDPSSLGGLLTHLASGAHTASYTDPNQAGAASGLGGEVLGQIFGSSGVAAQVGQQAARVSGVDPQVIQQMMPVVASMVMGGLTHVMNGQGLGGILGQLANAATSSGGLGSATNPAGSPPASGGGLLDGLLGSVMGALTGGGSGSATSESAEILAGLNTLTSMLHSGVQVSPEHQQALDQILPSSGQDARN